MCEPAHSIVQLPPHVDDDDDDELGGGGVGRPGGGTPSGSGGILRKWREGVGEFGRKVRGWFQFSSMGKGHSESMTERLQREGSKVTLLSVDAITAHTRYEAFWWERKFDIDGPFLPRTSFNRLGLRQLTEIEDEKVLRQVAYECAQEYANLVSIGSTRALRQFLDVSLRRTLTPGQYAQCFELMLNKKGKEEYHGKLRAAFGRGTHRSVNWREGDNLERLKKLMLGFTRRRGLLVPEWADDNPLWVPSTV